MASAKLDALVTKFVKIMSVVWVELAKKYAAQIHNVILDLYALEESVLLVVEVIQTVQAHMHVLTENAQTHVKVIEHVAHVLNVVLLVIAHNAVV